MIKKAASGKFSTWD